MRLNYTKEFAEQHDSTIMVWAEARKAVIDLSITLSDWMANPKNWFAGVFDGACLMYTEAEVKGYWKCVELAREKMMARKLITDGKAIALNPALEMVRGSTSR